MWRGSVFLSFLYYLLFIGFGGETFLVHPTVFGGISLYYREWDGSVGRWVGGWVGRDGLGLGLVYFVVVVLTTRGVFVLFLFFVFAVSHRISYTEAYSLSRSFFDIHHAHSFINTLLLYVYRIITHYFYYLSHIDVHSWIVDLVFLYLHLYHY